MVSLTHRHFDHLQELPTPADHLVAEIDELVVIAAMAEVFDSPAGGERCARGGFANRSGSNSGSWAYIIGRRSKRSKPSYYR